MCDVIADGSSSRVTRATPRSRRTTSTPSVCTTFTVSVADFSASFSSDARAPNRAPTSDAGLRVYKSILISDLASLTLT